MCPTSSILHFFPLSEVTDLFQGLQADESELKNKICCTVEGKRKIMVCILFLYHVECNCILDALQR